MADEGMSGLTEAQAKEFHRGFMVSMAIWIAVAVVAHILTWAWRPWFPGTDPYERAASVIDGANSALTSVMTFLA